MKLGEGFHVLSREGMASEKVENVATPIEGEVGGPFLLPALKEVEKEAAEEGQEAQGGEEEGEEAHAGEEAAAKGGEEDEENAGDAKF